MRLCRGQLVGGFHRRIQATVSVGGRSSLQAVEFRCKCLYVVLCVNQQLKLIGGNWRWLEFGVSVGGQLFMVVSGCTYLLVIQRACKSLQKAVWACKLLYQVPDRCRWLCAFARGRACTSLYDCTWLLVVVGA